MKTLLAAARKFSLFFAAAFLALQASPGVAADAGSGTFVGTIDKKPVSITFKEVYAFRAEGSR